MDKNKSWLPLVKRNMTLFDHQGLLFILLFFQVWDKSITSDTGSSLWCMGELVLRFISMISTILNLGNIEMLIKEDLAGFTDDEFQGIILDNDRLVDGMNFYKQYRDQSMLFIIGTYFLNILDANIDAHLKQYNLNQNLSLKPYIDYHSVVADHHIGVSLNFNF